MPATDQQILFLLIYTKYNNIEIIVSNDLILLFFKRIINAYKK